MTIDELLDRARQRLDRVNVEDAADAVRDGAVIVDIRSELQRARDGLIPDAIFHPRNVLEWRCDQSSGHDDPRLSGDRGRRVVLVCNEGCQSSLAAATLQDLGFARATDLVGGFQAWAAAGSPVLNDGDVRARIQEHWEASERGDVDVEHAIYAADGICAAGTRPNATSPSAGSWAAAICGRASA